MVVNDRWGKNIRCKHGGFLDCDDRYNPGTTQCHYLTIAISPFTGQHSAVGNVSGNRCKSDCRSRGCEFDPGPVPYFRGD